MSGVVDSGNNFIFEMHQYLDSDYSGTHDTCASATIGSEALTDATAWLEAHNARAILGEFASGRDDTCMAALADMLAFMDTNNDQWVGWTYFSGGPWWPASNTMMIEPVDGADVAQIPVLVKHL